MADANNLDIIGKGIMIGAGFIGPTIGIALVGASYLSAVGRNPEAAKLLGQALVFVGLIEVYGLLAFSSYVSSSNRKLNNMTPITEFCSRNIRNRCPTVSTKAFVIQLIASAGFCNSQEIRFYTNGQNIE